MLRGHGLQVSVFVMLARHRTFGEPFVCCVRSQDFAWLAGYGHNPNGVRQIAHALVSDHPSSLREERS